MNTSPLLQVFLLLPATLLALTFFYNRANAEEAEWSREAISLPQDAENRRMEVISSDGRKKAVIDGVKLSVLINGKYLHGIENAGINTLAELQWSPDSTALFVTESYGGAVGDWHAILYLIEGSVVRRLDVTKQVVNSFKKHYRCKEPEEPNIGAIKWFNGAKKLLIVAEVPPHSSCPEMGKIRGYIVEIPTGGIFQEFDEKRLRTEWGDYLGKRFKQ